MKRTLALLLLLSSTAAFAQAPVVQRGSAGSGPTGGFQGDSSIPVFQGEISSAPVGQPLPVDVANPVADLQTRISDLEDRIRQLTGQVEEQGYKITQLQRDLETAQKAQPAAPATPPAAAAPAPATPAAAPAPTTPAPAAPAAAPAQPVTGNLPAGSASNQYAAAFALLQQGNYPGAEQAFRAFLKANPKDQLAGNAQYWLGETLYVRKDYSKAAEEFLKGYQSYPTSSKAPDSLLKLALSLTGLGQNQQACQTLARLNQDFPALNLTLKQRADQERARLQCK